MPAKEIKELRQSGKLEEALSLAKSELEADSNNIWCKRNISWVFYDYLKQNNSSEQLEQYINWINEIKNLNLPEEEKMLFEQLSWQLGKMIFSLLKENPDDNSKIIHLFDEIKPIAFPKPNQGYSFLFKSLHKALKNTDKYIEFADWWNLTNFLPEDYQKEKLPNGKEVMSITEQAYIAYTKQLLPKQTQRGESFFNKEKASEFLPILSEIVGKYPQFQYPAYFNAKLLLALGDKDNMLETLLPFAKKKRNDFWVWDMLSEAFTEEPEKVFSCYCKALLCNSPEEMLVNIRQKMASVLISKKLYNEAKTEIVLLIKARTAQGYKIPGEVEKWKSESWYKNASEFNSNVKLYGENIFLAESILYSDIAEEFVFVEFVNSEKRVLNYISLEEKYGFFKYDRFFKKIEVGDVLKVRLQNGSVGSIYQAFTAIKVKNEDFKNKFVKEVDNLVIIRPGNSFGFIDDVFLHPGFIKSNNLKTGDNVRCFAIKSYNPSKKELSWKAVRVIR